MAKKDYLQPEVRAFALRHAFVLAASEKAPIPCVQFGGDEPGDDTAEETEDLF
ncbi:MAG: hypothetical protein HUK01_07075 [Bacteroidaceae bacterium]|nr:hypothetical protein [Bacteroidaceae bacterium]